MISLDVLLVGMSGEFFLEYGIRAQEIFGPDTISLGYTHGCQSYVPTDRALSEGGYEPGAWKKGVYSTVITCWYSTT